MNEIFKPLYLPGADQTKIQPTFRQTLASAFNLENDVVNVYDLLTRPVFEPDPNFNFKETFKAAQLPVDWMPLLSSAQSQGEFQMLVGKAQKEFKDKAVLAASGWSGTVAALGAGIVSPTVFIPFAGQARGAKGMAQIVALATAGATAQNAALFFNQSTRTEAELYSGIALDTLLMGMMGGAWLGLSAKAQAKLKADITFNQSKAEVPDGPLDVFSGAVKSVQVEDDPIEELMATPQSASPEVTFDRPNITMEDILPPVNFAPGQAVRIKQWFNALYPEKTSDDFRPSTDELKAKAARMQAEAMYDQQFAIKPMERGPAHRRTPSAEWTGYDMREALRSADAAEAEAARKIQEAMVLEQRAKAPRVDLLNDIETEMLKEFPELADQIETDPYLVLRSAMNDDTIPMIEEIFQPSSRQGDSGMVRLPDQPTIPTSRAADAEPVGAQVSRSRNTLGAQAAPSRWRQASMDALGRLSPSYRMLTNKFFPSLRHGIAKLDMSGIRQGGLESAEASARGGTVIERIRGYDYNIVKFAKTLDENYYRYIHGTNEGFDFGSPAVTQLKSMMGRMPQGKMNWSQYKEAVFDALNTGDIPPDIADSVSAFKEFFENYTARQKQYLAEFKAAGIDVPPLFKELLSDELGEGIEGYAHHIFSKQKLMENFAEFLDDFAGYNERQLLERFAKARKRYAKRRTKLEFEKLIAEMDPDAVSARLDEVESDLEFLEEIPEWQDFRDRRLALNRQAKDEGWSKEMLKEEQKKLQESLSPAVVDLQNERKALMQTAKVLRDYGGDASEKTAKLKAEIEKGDALIDSMFRNEIPGIERADLSIEKIQAQGDKAMKSVTSQLEKMVKALAKRQAQMTKLLASKRNNTVSRARVAELLEKDRVKYAGLLEQLETVKGQQVALDLRLRELWRIREEVIADSTRLVKKRAAKVGDLEDRLEDAAAKVITPEERARMRDQVQEEMDALEGKFRMDWSDLGERSGDPVTTEAPDFKDKAREMAVMLHQKLMNTEVELSPAYHAVRQDVRGAELLRTLKIPYAIKNKWLEKDVEIVTRAYDRVMAPDLEIWRAFDGSVNAKSLLAEMQEEATEHLARISTAKYVKLPKGWTDKAGKFADRVKKSITDIGESSDLYLEPSNFSDTPGKGFIEITPELRNQLAQSVHDAVKASTRDVDVAIQRLRSTRGVPQDSGSIMWRSGKFVKNLNVTTMMGGVVTSSISDVARPIWRHGIAKTLGRGWLPFIKKLPPGEGNFRLRSKEINSRIGLNLEPMLHSRAQGVFDLAAETVDRTRIERAATVLANKTGLIAMYDYWTAGMKTISGNIVHATMAEYVPAVAAAWRKGVEPTGDLLQMRTYLRTMGLSDLDIHRIAMQMEKPGGVENFSNGGVLPNLDKWDDPAAYQAYQAAVIKEVNELIVTPGLERPNWTDENMAYSLVAQFKAFTFSSSSRMAMSGLQGNDPYLMQGIAFSLAFGALSYYAYALSAGGRTWEEANQMDPEKWAWEAVKRSGVLGALSLGTDVAGELPVATGEEPTIFTRPSGLLGVFLGPTYGQAEKMATVATQINSDDPKQQARNLRMLRQVWVPYQNHFLFRQLFDRAGEAMNGG